MSDKTLAYCKIELETERHSADYSELTFLPQGTHLVGWSAEIIRILIQMHLRNCIGHWVHFDQVSARMTIWTNLLLVSLRWNNSNAWLEGLRHVHRTPVHWYLSIMGYCGELKRIYDSADIRKSEKNIFLKTASPCRSNCMDWNLQWTNIHWSKFLYPGNTFAHSEHKLPEQCMVVYKAKIDPKVCGKGRF